jgi:23S rRNA (cytidine1920-2'-O)/16S rRNA (cytidine1409-2'-O)-methyltransferase
MGKRERLDLLLVQRELVSSREEGRRRILAAEVLVNEQPLTKAGALVDQTAEVRLKAVAPYVSRGGLKLEKALRQFQIDIKDKWLWMLAPQPAGLRIACYLMARAGYTPSTAVTVSSIGSSETIHVW